MTAKPGYFDERYHIAIIVLCLAMLMFFSVYSLNATDRRYHYRKMRYYRTTTSESNN